MSRTKKPLVLHEGQYSKASKESRKVLEEQMQQFSFDLDNIILPKQLKGNKVAENYFLEHIEYYRKAKDKGVQLFAESDINALVEYSRTYAELEKLVKLQKEKCSTELYLKIDSRIDKKRAELIKQQGNLFLNPASRVKNIPVDAPIKKKSKMAEFLERTNKCNEN